MPGYDGAIIEWLEDPATESEVLTSVDLQRQTIRRLINYATEEVAADIATAAVLYPTASPYSTVGATLAGMPSTDDMRGEIAALEQQHTGVVGGVSSFFAEIGDGIRGIVRGAALAFGGAYDELINRPLRTNALADQGLSLGEAYAASGNAPFGALGEAVGVALAGGNVNLGTGWLPNSELSDDVQNALAELNEAAEIVGDGPSAERDAVYEAYRRQYGFVALDWQTDNNQQMLFQTGIREKILEDASTPGTALGDTQARFGAPVVQRQLAEADSVYMSMGDNIPWRQDGQYSQVSMGRVYANLIVEPGTRPFHYISGALDFMANIVMDPANFAGMGIAKVTKARKVLRAGDEVTEVAAGFAKAEEAVLSKGAEIKGVNEAIDATGYNRWSPDYRDDANRLAQGQITPETVASKDPSAARHTPERFKKQEAGRLVRQERQLQSELGDLLNSPELGHFDEWSDAARGSVDEIARMDVMARSTYLKTRPEMRRRWDIEINRQKAINRMGELESEIVGIHGQGTYKTAMGWTEKYMNESLDLAKKADVDRIAHPRLAEKQRKAREVVALATDIDAKGRELLDLKNVATYDHQVRRVAGILEGGARVDLDVAAARKFLGGATASRYIDALVGADELWKIDKILDSVKGPIPNKLRLALADADDRTSVLAAILPYIGEEIVGTGMIAGSRSLATPLLRVTAAVSARKAAKLVEKGQRLNGEQVFAGGRLGRMFSEMSPRTINLEKLDDGYVLLAAHAKNLGWSRGDELLEAHLRKFAELEPGDWQEAFKVMADYNFDLMNRLVEGGLDPGIAKTVTRFLYTEHVDDGLFNLNRLGDPMQGPVRTMKVTSDKIAYDVVGPQLTTELFKGQVHLADPGLVRHAAAELDKFGRVMNQMAGSWGANKFDQRWTVRVANQIMTKAWKPAVLLRLAWPIRVIGEEQARKLAAGIELPMNHPIHFIARVIADRTTGTKGGTNLMGDALANSDEFARAGARRATFQGDWRVRGTEHWEVLRRGKVSEVRYRDAYLRNLNQLWSDPIVQKLFRELPEGMSAPDRIGEVVIWLRTGGGRKFLDDLMRNTDDGTRQALKDPEMVAAYVESVYARSHMMAGGDYRRIMPDGSWVDSRGRMSRDASEFMATGKRVRYEIMDEAVAPEYARGIDEILESYGTGKFRGNNVAERFAESAEATGKGMTDINDVRKGLDQLMGSADGKRLPGAIKGTVGPDAELAGKYDAFVTRWFDRLMSKPTNYLSRHPVFRQKYWQRVGEMSKHMDEATYLQAKAAAKASGESSSFLKGAGARKKIIGQTDTRSGVDLITKLDDVDQLAKARALDDVQTLLFDYTKRKNVSDAFSLVMPFADAWGEVVGTWARIMRQENIRPFNRFRQVVESGRSSNFDPFDKESAKSGWTNQGFFTNNGDREVFTIPGLNQLWELLSGVDADFEMSLQGLSIATDVLPAVGPVVQIPAQHIIPNNAEWDWLREYIAPFGEQSIQKGLTPSSWQRAIAAWDWSRNMFSDQSMIETFNAAVADALSAMAREDPDGFVERNRTDPAGVLADARGKASRLFWVQAIARFVGPAAPSTKPTVEDKNGFVWQTTVLSDEFFNLLQSNDGDRIAATELFIAKFGIDPIHIATSKTTQVRPGGLTSSDFNFKRDNAELFEAFPNIAYFLGPAWLSDVGDFNFNAYYQEIAEDSRERLTPEQFVRVMNDTKGTLAYQERKRQMEVQHGKEWTDAGWDTELKDQLQNQLKNYGQRLMHEYPGYAGPGFGSRVEGLPDRVDVAQQIVDLERLLIQRPEMIDEEKWPAIYATAQYLELRAYANNLAQTTTSETSTMSAGESDPESSHYQRRLLLRQDAALLIYKYPEFGPIWEQIFAREMTDDHDTELQIDNVIDFLNGVDNG